MIHLMIIWSLQISIKISYFNFIINYDFFSFSQYFLIIFVNNLKYLLLSTDHLCNDHLYFFYYQVQLIQGQRYDIDPFN
jgi:hypothetical protein